MLSIDWRSSAAYEHAEKIPAAGFAWEYLRRHDDYHRDYEDLMTQRPPSEDVLGVFSRRWGLRFPPRPQ
jgi:Family of unknown function (DUF6499)